METDTDLTPLAITVTAAGKENLTLRALLREAIPMLVRPEAYSRAQRVQLAQNAGLLLEGALDAVDVCGDSDDYEPGAWLEEDAPW
jgi:hypothetical protein